MEGRGKKGEIRESRKRGGGWGGEEELVSGVYRSVNGKGSPENDETLPKL